MPSNKPILSVILPAYNAEKYIGEAIESILHQSFTMFELIIADDGSNDNTKSIIDSYYDQRIIISHNKQNVGKTATVNRLFGFAKGEYVTIHDADDFSSNERFDVQISFLEKNNSSYVMCGTNFVSINEKGKQISFSTLKLKDKDLKKGLNIESQFHGPTIIFKKNTLSKLMPIYREFFKDYNEDYDLCMRISEKGKIANVPGYLYKYRLTKESLSRNLTIQKKYSPNLVKKLAVQRKLNGTDDLENGNLNKLNNLIQEFSVPYINDKSLLFRQQAELDFYYGFYLKSLKNSIYAIRKTPFELVNYRLFQHVLRKIIFKF